MLCGSDQEAKEFSESRAIKIESVEKCHPALDAGSSPLGVISLLLDPRLRGDDKRVDLWHFSTVSN